MADIEYTDFYDIPHFFVVNHAGSTYLFDGSFDDAADEYAEDFTVFLLPPMTLAAARETWRTIHTMAVRPLGTVPASSVRFAGERLRRQVDVEVLGRIVPRTGRARVTRCDGRVPVVRDADTSRPAGDGIGR